MTQPQQPYSSPVQPSHVAPDAGMPSQPAFGEGAQHHRRARHTGHFGPRPQHLDLANPSAWGAPEQGADLPPAVGTRRPSPRQGMPGEPTIDAGKPEPGGSISTQELINNPPPLE